MHDCAHHTGPSGRRFKLSRLLWIAPLAIVAMVGIFLGAGFLMTWLWRVTIGDIFGVKPITFWQAIGLLFLAQLLFKGSIHPRLPARCRHHRCVMEDETGAPKPEAPGPGTSA